MLADTQTHMSHVTQTHTHTYNAAKRAERPSALPPAPAAASDSVCLPTHYTLRCVCVCTFSNTKAASLFVREAYSKLQKYWHLY